MHVLDKVILIMFLSFVVGVIVDPVLRRVTDYESLSTRHLFSATKTYETWSINRGGPVTARISGDWELIIRW